jgi:hypothetical protein
MNYEQVYSRIVERGKQRILEGYGENHHIVPKCLGGADTQDNIVRLTAREHYLVHYLLQLLHPTNRKLRYAFYMMCTMHTEDQERYKVSARTYAYAKTLVGERSLEMRKQISETLKEAYRTGRRTSNAGKKMPKAFGESISAAKKGMIGTNLGIPMKEEQKKKISETLKGHQVKQSTKDKIAQTLKNKPELTCPYCNKKSRGSAFKFYHFESCKFKK